ncbi:hypothetical protein Mrad2831_2555 [Methylobacterium radiotolerans JCM 2831]|uniref:DUF427 domain-containing protein n=2 Tax=Methylobacterium TaxID=407 RepID=B1M0Z5_METRJ|nr:hypothetical protein Mrad2831_2555 [Methylobacterium radiotolerans JCM 2831]GEN01642.1 hypothetical protein MRA01_61810 [Methylobacterium radiotolerans]
MAADGRTLKVVHRASGTVLAEGPTGWGMTRFDGGIYIRRRHLVGGTFSVGIVPGLCVYKGFYLSLDYTPPDGPVERALGWIYVVPNPLLPFIWYRVAVPKDHPALDCIA